jgi:predicted transcriptional regulator
MTILDRLARRGCVARHKHGRSYVYAPILTRDAVRRLAVRDLVERYFDGSEDCLRLYLAEAASSALS